MKKGSGSSEGTTKQRARKNHLRVEEVILTLSGGLTYPSVKFCPAEE